MTSGEKPGPRFAASFTSVPSRLCLFGGSGVRNEFLDDTVMFDPVSRVWEPVGTAGEGGHEEEGLKPLARWGHASVAFKGRVVMFGTFVQA